MLQAVIFDHDGTLVPTMERQHNWFKNWWRHPVNEDSVQGREFPYSDFKSFMEMYNEKINHPKDVQNVYDFLNLKCDMNDFNHPVWPAYKAFSSENPSVLYPDMKWAVEEIFKMGSLDRGFSRNKRIRLALNTSNSWSIVSGDLEKNNILQYFDSYVSKEILSEYHGFGGANGIKKPSSISLAYALGILDASGDSVIHVGDSLVDLAAGKKIQRLGLGFEENLKTIGVTWGYAGEGRGKDVARSVLESGVEIPGKGRHYFDYIVDTPKELVNIISDYIKK